MLDRVGILLLHLVRFCICDQWIWARRRLRSWQPLQTGCINTWTAARTCTAATACCPLTSTTCSACPALTPTHPPQVCDSHYPVCTLCLYSFTRFFFLFCHPCSPPLNLLSTHLPSFRLFYFFLLFPFYLHLFCLLTVRHRLQLIFTRYIKLLIHINPTTVNLKFVPLNQKYLSFSRREHHLRHLMSLFT